MNKRIILFLLVALLACGCASKRYAKKAKELEKAGLYMDAAEMYYKSAKANRNNVDAKIGLRTNGQLALDKKIESFKGDYTNRNIKAAVYSYQDAFAYERKIASVGVQLEIPSTVQQYYKEVKEEYLDERYNEGTSALDRDDFEMAGNIFREIKRLDANYRDVNAQLVVAQYEPVYRRANEELTNGMFRSAYYDFAEVLKGAHGQYKEADVLKREAQEKAMITMAVVPFDAPYFTQRQTANFSNKIISGIKRFRSPFISFKDYSMVSDRSYIGRGVSIKAARAAGIKAVIVGRVTNYRVQEGKVHTVKRKVYIRREVKYKDKEGNSKTRVTYDKDWYIEYYASNSVDISVEYQLISTETGEVISADSYSRHGEDVIRFARYNGSYKKLVPGKWKYQKGKRKDDRVYDDKASVRKLHRLFRAREILTPTYKISDDLERSIAALIAKGVVNYNPER